MIKKKKMSRLSSKFIAFFIVLFSFISLNAFAGYFYIKDYNSDIYIHKNSVVDVKETIKVHFYEKRHGIYRFIPYRYKTDSILKTEKAIRPFSADKLYKLDIFNIKTPGFKNKIYKKGNNIVIRIGTPRVFVDGDITYVITYSIYGTVNFFKDHSEFYLNVIGKGWGVPIMHSSFDVILPQEEDNRNIKYAVFEGYASSTHKEHAALENGILECSIEHTLKPHQALTVLVAMPKGYLSNGSVFMKFRLFIMTNRVFFIPFLTFIILYVVWLIVGKDEQKVIMTYYKPPEGITSAEAGVLIDDKIDNRDLISLIFYWASNGYMEIEESENRKAFFKHKDYILKKIKDLPENAKEFEKIIFNGLFVGNVNMVRISSLKDKFYETMKMARKSLDMYIKDKKVYEKGTRTISKILLAISLSGVFYSMRYLIKGQITQFLAIILTLAILFIFSRIMPKKTKVGLKEYEAIRGFKEFMDRVEKDRLKELLKENPEYFYNTLSFAIAFGEHKKWVKKFSDLVTEPPKWYSGYGFSGGTFSAYAFMNSLNGSIGSVSHVFVSTPSGNGSSGFSGGGFAGGGMGGGGGGSW